MKQLFFLGLIPTYFYITAPVEKQYIVSHTKTEWVLSVQAKVEIQRRIHKTDMAVRDADFCDSVLQADYMDVNRQVGAQIQADTLTNKTKKP